MSDLPVPDPAVCETITKWSSLVQPGDVIGEAVVIATRSRISVRDGSSVVITVARPISPSGRFEDVEWVEREELRYTTGYEPVEVVEAIWPTRW